LEKPAFSGFSALGNALLLGLFALSDGLLVLTCPYDCARYRALCVLPS
jgi:hypothetical protein